MPAWTLSTALAVSLLGCTAAAQEAAFEGFRYAGSDPENSTPLETGQ